MEWLLLLVAGGGVGGLAWTRVRAVRGARRERDQQLEHVRRLAEEDVTVLGEQLALLDAQLGGRDLDPAAREDYQAALDGYERATREAPRLSDLTHVRPLTETLSGARHAIVCVQARMAGQPVPERRVPCFFNPQHGPSTTVVEWRFPRSGTHRYPVCGQCAARVRAHEPPDVRTVEVGRRRLPYWEAGTTYAPYTQGYFDEAQAMGVAMTWAWTVQADRMSGQLGLHGGASFGGGFDVGGDGGGGGD
ncbi:hypothetical protein [Nocardioides coralli]|uniref:hypothetical protein n=1 Tax=Nocardioides coralli TaxID=2872154 RepID=UPI001CA4416D|nr:hypothetical protein [Nocardioides coralli]QZY30471.1 hypothetical protein K6T13_07420 [Nocardioides coralli]